MADKWDAEAIRIVGLCRRLHDSGVYSFSNGEAHDRVAAALRAAYEQGVEDMRTSNTALRARVTELGVALIWIELSAKPDHPAPALLIDSLKRCATAALSGASSDARWPLGMMVHKIKGASWRGRIVGHYSTDLTPEGYCVESAHEPGSVQIYPRAALALSGKE